FNENVQPRGLSVGDVHFNLVDVERTRRPWDRPAGTQFMCNVLRWAAASGGFESCFGFWGKACKPGRPPDEPANGFGEAPAALAHHPIARHVGAAARQFHPVL